MSRCPASPTVPRPPGIAVPRMCPTPLAQARRIVIRFNGSRKSQRRNIDPSNQIFRPNSEPHPRGPAEIHWNPENQPWPQHGEQMPPTPRPEHSIKKQDRPTAHSNHSTRVRRCIPAPHPKDPQKRCSEQRTESCQPDHRHQTRRMRKAGDNRLRLWRRTRLKLLRLDAALAARDLIQMQQPQIKQLHIALREGTVRRFYPLTLDPRQAPSKDSP